MYTLKRHPLFAALAASLLLASCSKTEPDTPLAPAAHISAKARGAESVVTKTPLEGTSLDGKQAQVYTTRSPLDNYTGNKPRMFTDAYAAGTMTFKQNSYVEYDAAGLNGNELLPLDKSAVYLYGFYPTGWTTANVGTYESLQRTFDGKTDLMATWVTAADRIEIAYGGGALGSLPDKADCMFRHLLTRYQVQVKCSDADAQTIWGRIQSIKLKNETVNKVSTGQNLGYTYSAGGGTVSFYNLGGTTAAPTYTDDLFAKAAFTDMLPLTTTYQNACYTMATPVDVDADASTAELTLVVVTLDREGGRTKTVEVPLSFDQNKLTAALLANNTGGYSITVALNFRAGLIEASALVEAWKDGGEQTETVKPPVPPKIGQFRDGGIVFWVNPADPQKYKIFSLDQGSTLLWSSKDAYAINTTDAQDRTDGRKNMAAIKAAWDAKLAGIAITESTFAEAFPAAAFCEAKNTGGVTDWYIPAVDELEELLTVYKANQTMFDAAIVANGGVMLKNNVGAFLSGTECYYSINDTFMVFYQNLQVNHFPKTTTPPPDVRCIKSN